MNKIDKEVKGACKFLNMDVPSYLEFKFSQRKGKINSLIGRGVYAIFNEKEVFYVGMSNTANTGGMRLRFLSHLRKINLKANPPKYSGKWSSLTASWRYFLEEYAVAMDVDVSDLTFRAYHMFNNYRPSQILALESILIDKLQPIANDEVYNFIMENTK